MKTPEAYRGRAREIVKIQHRMRRLRAAGLAFSKSGAVPMNIDWQERFWRWGEEATCLATIHPAFNLVTGHEDVEGREVW